MNGIDWLASRIIAAANRDLEEGASAASQRFNPRPPGVIRDGSATQAVLEFLAKHPGRFFSHPQIVAATSRSPKSVDWALLFLRAKKKVRAVPANSAHSNNYLRYSVAQEGDDAKSQ
jgi:DNA-binding response OmpR family regulator